MLAVPCRPSCIIVQVRSPSRVSKGSDPSSSVLCSAKYDIRYAEILVNSLSLSATPSRRALSMLACTWSPPPRVWAHCAFWNASGRSGNTLLPQLSASLIQNLYLCTSLFHLFCIASDLALLSIAPGSAYTSNKVLWQYYSERVHSAPILAILIEPRDKYTLISLQSRGGFFLTSLVWPLS